MTRNEQLDTVRAYRKYTFEEGLDKPNFEFDETKVDI